MPMVQSTVQYRMSRMRYAMVANREFAGRGKWQAELVFGSLLRQYDALCDELKAQGICVPIDRSCV